MKQSYLITEVSPHQSHHVLDLVHDVAVPVRGVYVQHVSQKLPVWGRGGPRHNKNYTKAHVYRLLIRPLTLKRNEKHRE